MPPATPLHSSPPLQTKTHTTIHACTRAGQRLAWLGGLCTSSSQVQARWECSKQSTPLLAPVWCPSQHSVTQHSKASPALPYLRARETHTITNLSTTLCAHPTPHASLPRASVVPGVHPPGMPGQARDRRFGAQRPHAQMCAWCMHRCAHGDKGPGRAGVCQCANVC